jgi:two-component sensor histidine kinase
MPQSRPFFVRPSPQGPWLLLSEMGHRVANEYSLAASSISIVASRTADPDAKAALDCAIRRLLDYADAHRVLQAPISA